MLFTNLKIGTGEYYVMALFIHGEHITAVICTTNFRVFINEFLTFLRGNEYRIFQINIPDFGSIRSSEELVRCS
jgi:hypothetical protein